MSSLSSVRAVFFDLDDTLCGYWDASKAAMRQAFREAGPAHLTPDEMVSAWAMAFREFSREVKNTEWYGTYLREGGLTRTEQMRRTLGVLGIDDEAMAQRLSQYYHQFRQANLKLFPEALGVLKALHGRYPMGLITNGPADIQREEIAVCEIGSFFEHVVIEGEMLMGKPSPEVFAKAEQLSGCKPHELLFVGNSYGHDIVPAIDAGWFTAWIRRPSDVAPSRDGEGKPEEKPDDGRQPTMEICSLEEILVPLGC